MKTSKMLRPLLYGIAHKQFKIGYTICRHYICRLYVGTSKIYADNWLREKNMTERKI
jgi:hypothetical protein